MREEIRRERKVELAFEGHGYWDLIRWKTAEVELPKTLLGSYLFTEYLTATGDKWSDKTVVNDQNYIVLQPASLRKLMWSEIIYGHYPHRKLPKIQNWCKIQSGRY